MFRKYTTLSKDELFRLLNTSEAGLTSREAQDLQEKYGLNKIESHENNAWQILINQFKSPFFFLLLGATIISFLLKEYIDSAMVLLFVTINTFLGFIQEYRSNQAAKLLKKFIVQKTKVVRNGTEQEIASEFLVPGDLIILEPGDILPAEVRFIRTDGLAIDESVLTGETNPREKQGKPLISEVKEVYKAKNIGFSGTTVLNGKGFGFVIATGAFTEYGKIAKLTTSTTRETIFEKEIASFSRFILKLVIITLFLLFVTNILFKPNKTNIPELAIFSVTLAVSVIPEALPVVTTFSLTRGALLLVKKKVVVKRLSAIEDLGSIEVLATDKTGTITENKLSVEDTFGLDKSTLLILSSLAGTNTKLTNPFDISTWQALNDKERNIVKETKRIEYLPFDPKRRRTTALVEYENKKIIIERGAPEDILKLCDERSKSQEDKINKWIAIKGENGIRVLAVATKEIAKNSGSAIKKHENNCKFAGLIAFSDPLKPSAFEAIQNAKELGIQIKILTGDSIEVARAVALKTKLITDSSEAMVGDDFDNLTSEEKHNILDKIKVFARVTPEQKYSLIKLLEEKYEVGFLGEGINDAPALKIANVALVVDGATDIAREASDIILLQKSLKVIVDGIHEGRKVYANTNKYITATLASNFGNFYAVAIASLLIDFLPMLPLQILLVNLLSDFPMIAIATDNVDYADVAKPRRYRLRSIAAKATILGIVSTMFDFLFFAFFYKISPEVLQTYWFMGSILTELFFLFSIRTRYFFAKATPPSKIMVILTSLAATITVTLPFTSIGKSVFKFAHPTPQYLAITFGLVIAYLITTEIVKLAYNKIYSK